MNKTIFITGIGTGIGKTIVSAIITEALRAFYWKPVQAGYADGTDTEQVQSLVTNVESLVYPEVYRLKLAASPHLAAQNEGVNISIEKIYTAYKNLPNKEKPIVIEGPGGLLVPLNEKEFVSALIKRLNAGVILVSRNYLGSINHSLLTAQICRKEKIRVLGWVFNDQYMDYEDDIVRWSGYPKLGSIKKLNIINKQIIRNEADKIREKLVKCLS